MGKGTWVVVAGLGLLMGAGCFSPPPEALARLEEVKSQGDDLALAVDGLEERFLGTQANLMLWEELARRHRHVSAIACANHTEHFNAMVKKFEQNERKARTIRRRRVAEARAAKATVVSTSARAGQRTRNN